MLTKIAIKNVNAIRKCEIDFKKSKYQYRNEMILNNEFVSPIAFYGTNGSGKSSFLKAISQLVSLMIDEPDRLSPFIPNYTNVTTGKTISIEAAELRSSVKVWFRLKDIDYSYKIETSTQGKIVSEILFKGDEQIFNRSIIQYSYRGEKFKVESQMFPVLRKLDLERNDADIKECYQFLSNMAFVDASKGGYQFKSSKQKSYKEIIVEHSKEVNNILSTYKEFPLYDVFSQVNKLGKKEYYVGIKHETGHLVLPWELISGGMKNQSVVLSILLSLPENGVLIVDEIEDALHPLTVLDFINVIRERKVQLIFSSHNTYILQKLRPDQIFFANWKNGYSTYKRLSEIYPNIREINNIEKMYLSNLFEEDIKKDD